MTVRIFTQHSKERKQYGFILNDTERSALQGRSDLRGSGHLCRPTYNKIAGDESDGTGKQSRRGEMADRRGSSQDVPCMRHYTVVLGEVWLSRPCQDGTAASVRLVGYSEDTQ